MRTAKALPTLLVLLVLVGCQTQTEPTHAVAPVEPVTCGNVANVHKVGDLYLAGKPTAEDFAVLKDMGVKTVLNLRLDDETPDLDEGNLVENLGMAYVHVPWNGPEQLTDDKLDAMRQALREAERPIFFHCGSGNRVGAGWLAYRVLDEGVAVEVALAEAKAVGMRTAAYETIVMDYIARQKTK